MLLAESDRPPWPLARFAALARGMLAMSAAAMELLSR